MQISNIFKHIKLITKHKWVVFKLCCKAGIPWRGFLHDFSKYSPTEFLESIKYYNGHKSPIVQARIENGYSDAWLHHKGRNRHHLEYWIDFNAPVKTPIIPYKYAIEMLCDKLAAGIAYQGKDWTKEYPLNYWKKEKDRTIANEKIIDLITDCMTQISEKGIEPVINKENLKELYKKHCGNP